MAFTLISRNKENTKFKFIFDNRVYGGHKDLDEIIDISNSDWDGAKIKTDIGDLNLNLFSGDYISLIKNLRKLNIE